MSAGRSTDARRVCVIGLGRIGLPTAILCQRAGHDVTGVDTDPAVRDAIRAGELPYDEDGLTTAELTELSVASAGVEADVYILCIGTTGAQDQMALHGLYQAAADLPTTAGRLVVIESTVPPTTCDRIARMGHPRVAHCPERGRPGEILAEFSSTPRLIGGVDDASTALARAFYETLGAGELIECTADEAALAKLAENADREIRIAFANGLADVAWEYGLDGSRIAELASTHPRAELMRPGVGVGGTCLPMATAFFADRGVLIAERARSKHRTRPEVVAQRIADELDPDATICVLGRTYRPNTRNAAALDESYSSPAKALIEALCALGLDVVTWDPADEGPTLADTLADVDAYFVAVEHAEFAGLDDERRIRVF